MGVEMGHTNGQRVLVTGGTGDLGGAVVDRLDDAGFIVRVMSRRPSQLPPGSHREWAQADLASGEGLADAIRDIDIVVHAATDPKNSKAVDVDGTEALLEHAEDADVDHFVYVSIVGIDAWEFGWNPYYRHKLAAETAVDASSVPSTIQRATQFHSFIAGGFSKLRWLPLWPLPTRWQLQPIATRDVADRLVDVVENSPQGRAAPIGGPETRSLRELADQWQTAHGIRRPIIRLPIPGSVAASVRDGAMTTTNGPRGTETWRAWLDNNAEST